LNLSGKYLSISEITCDWANKFFTVLFGITCAALESVELIEATATTANTNPTNESMVFINGKGNRTTLKNPPKIPNKNMPKDAPRIIEVKPMIGLKPKELLEISD
jgi:hypothetical protein